MTGITVKDKTGLFVRQQWPMVTVWLLAFVMMAVGARGIYELFQRPADALRITACTPESFGEIPDRIDGSVRWKPGQEQVNCDAPFGVSDFSHTGITTSELINVVGQVCLAARDEVTYEVSVAWESVKTNDSFEVLRIPITYQPGCDQPYDIEWVVPPQLVALLRRDARDGVIFADEWKIVGTAVPFNLDLDETYTWDSTKRFFVTLAD